MRKPRQRSGLPRPEVHRNRGCVAAGHEHRHGHGQDVAGTLSRRVSQASRRSTPPIPAPKTPVRRGSTSRQIQRRGREKPASSHASRAAMRASCPEGSRRLASTLVEAAGFEGFNGKLTGDVDRQVVFPEPRADQSWRHRKRPGGVCPGGWGRRRSMGVVAPRPVPSTFRDIVALSLGWFCGWSIRWCGIKPCGPREASVRGHVRRAGEYAVGVW